ncbi:hypothetical protein [Pandoraea pnomenusa]|nr:hypothetical protein [Pandoraea pnomenusa]
MIRQTTSICRTGAETVERIVAQAPARRTIAAARDAILEPWRVGTGI